MVLKFDELWRLCHKHEVARMALAELFMFSLVEALSNSVWLRL